MEHKPHLTSLHVKGFRPFKHLSLTDLARVNLIVGKNSLGKTSVLEAISLYSSEGATSLIRDLLIKRDEKSLESQPEEDTEPGISDALAYESLFYDWPDLSKERPIISIYGTRKGLGKSDELIVQYCDIHEDTETRSDGRRVKTQGSLFSESEVMSGKLYPGLMIRFGPRERLFSFDSIDRVRGLRSIGFNHAPSFQFVPAEGLGRWYVSTLWDQIALREEEESIYDSLRLICRDLERVAFVSASRDRVRPTGRFALVKIRRHSKPVPLRSLGEGINHLFGLAVSLACAKNGFLLIDEIENGLHYSVMKGLWSLILKQSKDLGVQVFATTHSLDCIRGFQEASDGLSPTEASLIRLEGSDGKISGVSFDSKELKIVANQEIEVR